jgi:hypothetical protein
MDYPAGVDVAGLGADPPAISLAQPLLPLTRGAEKMSLVDGGTSDAISEDAPGDG